MEILKCANLNRRIGNFKFEDVSFELEAGYIMAVVGVNGAGKSTLLKCLMGAVELPKQTDVQIGGYSLWDNSREAKQSLAFVLTDCPFPMELTIRENVKLFAPLYDSWNMERYREWLVRFELNEKKQLQRLSKGELMRFQLAFALSYDAKVYFFDEPSANLDVEFRAEFYKIMRELVLDGDKSVVYVTQLVEELEGLADYILWLDKGKKLLCTDMEELQERFQIVTDLQGSEQLFENLLVGTKYRESHREALADCSRGKLPDAWKRRRASVAEIMYYFAENPASVEYLTAGHNEKKDGVLQSGVFGAERSGKAYAPIVREVTKYV